MSRGNKTTEEFLQDETNGCSDKNQDGGWGWVIVIVCFFCQFVTEGMIGSYGLLYPELLRYFEASPAVVALPGSLIVGTYLFMGLGTSGLIHKFGCRAVTFMGALIAALGFALSFPAKNIYVLIVCYGVISGIGIGILYLPSQLMVNTYFHRKRGIAQGIVCSGAGVGMIAIAPLVEVLLEYYGWRGTVLLCSCLFLQLCVLSLLMRPFIPSGSSSPQICSIENIENYEEKGLIVEDTPKLNVIKVDENKMSNDSMHTASIQEKTKHNQNFVKFPFRRDLYHESTSSLPLDVNATLRDRHAPYLSMQCVNGPKSQVIAKEFGDSDRNMLQRKDIFFSASTSFLTKYESFSALKTDPELNTEKSAGMSSALHLKSGQHLCSLGCESFAQMCKPSVLKNKAFILLSLGCILTQMAQFIPMVFMADYGLQIGLHRQQISTLFIIFGIVNAIGRLTAGSLATLCRRLSPLFICNLGFAACGVACFLFFLCTSFESLVAFMAFFGFFIGFFAPTQPLITLEYVGLDNLTSAYGFVTMVKGPAAVVGPPLAGGLYQLTKNHSYSNLAAGSLFLLTSILQSFIPCVSKPYLDRVKVPEIHVDT